MADLWERLCQNVMITNNRVTINVTREQLEQCPEGPYEASWQSVAANYRTPEWFMDAKFGIFIHWGVYSVPATGSEWYPKHMYNGLARSHRDKWGRQSQFGYKDFIPMFKAEKFDAQQWAELFKEAGARYVIPTAEHHDGFAMYDSDLTRWNAKQMGPRRDVIGELAEAVRGEGLKFGVSDHRIENW
ncbi:MAG: alpha-L-fucosidase, partial [Bacteroidales bacterium]|nr:alpha-L-fucosidase [Bacteroidales bacterium]